MCYNHTRCRQLSPYSSLPLADTQRTCSFLTSKKIKVLFSLRVAVYRQWQRWIRSSKIIHQDRWRVCHSSMYYLDDMVSWVVMECLVKISWTHVYHEFFFFSYSQSPSSWSMWLGYLLPLKTTCHHATCHHVYQRYCGDEFQYRTRKISARESMGSFRWRLR